MSKVFYDSELLTRYFLGVASTAEREAVEEQYFADESALHSFLQAEDEIIDDYVRGALSPSEQVLFEKNFLCTAERQRRVEFTKSLVATLAGTELGEFSSSHEKGRAVLLSYAESRPLMGISDLHISLLDWLDPVRLLAIEKYVAIRISLIQLFTLRGRVDAEELANETIKRVSQKVAELTETYVGDPAAYFYLIARRLLLNYQRGQAITPLPIVPEMISSGGDPEQAHQCLEKCLEKLSEKNRQLIVQYYTSDKENKVGTREDLARSLGVSLSALRIRAHKIRASLKECVAVCLENANELG